jgi:hypothetical protein
MPDSSYDAAFEKYFSINLIAARLKVGLTPESRHLKPFKTYRLLANYY